MEQTGHYGPDYTFGSIGEDVLIQLNKESQLYKILQKRRSFDHATSVKSSLDFQSLLLKS